MSAKRAVVRKLVSRTRPTDDKDGSGDDGIHVRSFATTGLFVLAVFYTAYFASAVIIPVTIGFLLSMILATPVRRLCSWGLPRPIGSAFAILLTIVAIGVPVYLLSEPAGRWVSDMPETASEIGERIKRLTTPIQDVKEAAEEVEKLTDLDGDNDRTPVVKVEAPSFGQVMLDSAPRLVMSAIFTIFLAYLLLCSGDAMLRKIIEIGCRIDNQRRSLVITKQIQLDLFRYLAAVTAVNVALGAATAGILYALDVPNALLWGAVAGLFNYAPLVGPAMTIVVLSIVGMTTFEPIGQALMVPFAYFVLTALEGNLISPAVIGRRLALSPVVVLLSLMLFGWMWGIPGLLLAVPIVSSARIICHNIPRLHDVATILGR